MTTRNTEILWIREILGITRPRDEIDRGTMAMMFHLRLHGYDRGYWQGLSQKDQDKLTADHEKQPTHSYDS